MNLLWTGFLMGLAGSFHCIAMCGPLIAGFTAGSGSKSSFVKSTLVKLIYHSGRFLSYALIGVLFGLLGEVISLFAYQQTISIIAGAFLLIWALSGLGIFNGRFSFGLLKWWPKVSSFFYARLKNYPKPVARFGAGMLNGLLPCGLVYVAATASVQGGSVGYSMLYMVFFGLGTLPALLGISVFIQSLKAKWRLFFNRSIPYFTLIVAALFILRGLSLNIPYLSPKIEQSPKGEIHSCCTKK